MMAWFNNISFANPGYFFLFILLIPLAIWYIYLTRWRNPYFNFTSVSRLGSVPKTLRQYMYPLPFVFRVLALSAIIIALARPQKDDSWHSSSVMGIDIVLVQDVSSSMLARDLEPSRLEAAKAVGMEFVSSRPNDKIGLVVFAGESFTQCPLTTDHNVLKKAFFQAKTGVLDDGTAIGMGLATAIARLKNSNAKSKVVILLTDGVNNRGNISPLTAAELAVKYGIRVYTIGAGTDKGVARVPVKDRFGHIEYRNQKVEIDEEVLKDIAKITDGKYFRATNNESLEKIYKEIDELERVKINVIEFENKEEKFYPFVMFALLFLIVEFIFRKLVLRVFP